MKKIFLTFVTVLCLFVLCLSFAVSAEETFTSFKNFPIVDGALLLTDEEEAKLSSLLTSVREKYDVDIAIYTDYTMTYDDVETAANSTYDNNEYGFGDDRSGILLYISAYPSEYWYVSNGSCYENAINDRGLTYIDNEVLPHLRRDDYYKAFEQFVLSSEYLLEKAESGHVYNRPPTKVISIAFCLIIGAPLLLAFLLTFLRCRKMNTVSKAQLANHYIDNDGLALTESKDIFLYSTTSKTRRETSSSSGGSRSRSGGGSRGGRGGRY